MTSIFRKTENQKGQRTTNVRHDVNNQATTTWFFIPGSSSISRSLQRCKTIPFHQIKRNNDKNETNKKIEKKESNKGERGTKQWEALFQARSGRNNVRPWRNGHGNKQKIAKKYSRGLRAWLKYHGKIYSPGIIRVFAELSQRCQRIL